MFIEKKEFKKCIYLINIGLNDCYLDIKKIRKDTFSWFSIILKYQ